MNIELEEVVVLDVTDDALEMAAGGQGGCYGRRGDVTRGRLWGLGC